MAEIVADEEVLAVDEVVIEAVAVVFREVVAEVSFIFLRARNAPSMGNSRSQTSPVLAQSSWSKCS